MFLKYSLNKLKEVKCQKRKKEEIKKAMSSWIWILIILVLLILGIGIYFWLSGSDGGLGGGIPQPPALPE